MDGDNFALNCSAFIAGLFLLHYGADLFVDHFTSIARRMKVPETLVILLTVGAEWKELAIVITSILQHDPALGLGTVIGSCTANVLGTFGFALLLHDKIPPFDGNSKVYAGALLVFSSVYLYLALTGHLGLTGGIFLLVAFAVYLMSICSAIYDHILSSPSTPTHTSIIDEETFLQSEDTLDEFHRELHISIFPTMVQCNPDEITPLVRTQPSSSTTSTHRAESTAVQHMNLYHAIKISIGLFALASSAYLLTHASSSLASALNLPTITFGMTFLSFFTTIPEKVPAAYTTWRGQSRIMVASIAGANIFLLTLCLGTIFVSGNGDESLTKGIAAFEIWIIWICALVLLLIVLLSGRKWMGGILLGFYAAFLGAEFIRGMGKN